MANKEQLKILKQGVKDWNKWRRDNIFVEKINIDINLSGANLSGANLSEANLSGANLSGANLSKAYIAYSCLIYTDLTDANLSEAILSVADLTDAILSKADFAYADLSDANLRGANLRGVDLLRADLLRADLTKADLSGASLKEANIEEADFGEANLSGTDFTYANIRGGANFKNSIGLPEWIEKGLDKNVTYTQQQLIYNIRRRFFKNLKEANLKNANLSGANLANADLSGANLIEADLTEADLEEADLRKANLTEADLSKANLTEADLRGANRLCFLSGADLSGANLSGVDLSGGIYDFYSAKLLGANLSGADLSGANLSGANLSEANLINSNFTNVIITGVNLYGSARDNWIIDSIKCDYFYNDPKGKIRIPKELNFKKGEFEELYKQLPSFEYIFKNGFTPIDAFIMDQVVQAINEQQPEIELKLDSFHSRGQSRSVFTVLHKHDIEETQKQIAYEYEKKIIVLEGKNEVLKELVLSSMKKPLQHIERLITMGDNINFSGNGNIAFGKDNANVRQNNIDYKVNKELLTEINKLKEELSTISIDQTNKDAIDFQVEILENQAKLNKNNPILMNSTLESIKTITQGALGSAMGTGLVETFHRVGSMIL